ncbi:MAG TPA: c-type cytochrome [Longimicrobiaceae bacterium]|nr:c-type cytochrome [Longimicrobiaceae bacterium]
MRDAARWGVAALGALALAACGLYADESSYASAAALTGGDPRAGRQKIRDYGCDACHAIPGIPGADRTVGPPLEGIAGRMYIAGLLTNQPENMVRWIMDPPAVDPKTAMPDMDVAEDDARDIAAYLYTLR